MICDEGVKKIVLHKRHIEIDKALAERFAGAFLLENSANARMFKLIFEAFHCVRQQLF